MLSNMRAVQLVRIRIVHSAAAFAEMTLWKLAVPIAGSTHACKYRLAYVVNGICVVRYDNEAGKGDHRHVGKEERRYRFTTPERLITDFQHDIARWNHENRDT